MVRGIVWSKRAEKLFFDILEFYYVRNKSKTYSRKLNSEIKQLIKILAKQPFLGRKTEKNNIRVLIKGNYKIFYEIEPEEIVILLVWDTRQNPENFKL
ncbi:MAG: type II toxin-antitoxin system RelE/ParE family toxin [Bacteroidetes bacterium]|nr:MAG: type II toxin-antitoxin system RelE/ParE family toxin [Bacteroidota bacterium]